MDQMVNKKNNNNSSTSLVFGLWPKTKKGVTSEVLCANKDVMIVAYMSSRCAAGAQTR